MDRTAKAWYARFSGQCGAMGPFRFASEKTESEAMEAITKMWAKPDQVWPARGREGGKNGK